MGLHEESPPLSPFPMSSSANPKSAKRENFDDAHQVHIRVVFMKVGNIDTVKQQFNADIFMQARWREPALDMNENSTEKPSVEELWEPELAIRNTIECTYKKKWKDVQHSQAGEAFVYEKRRFKGTFYESMQLQNFPFDTQHLSIAITTEDDDIEFVEDPIEASYVNRTNFVNTKEWQIYHIVEFVPDDTQGEEEFSDDQQTATQSVMVARMYAARRARFYVYNILLIMGLICSLATCAWTVERNYPKLRLKLTFILVLTSVALMYVKNQDVPKVPYTTLLGKYIMVCLALLVLCSAWHTTIHFPEKGSTIGDTVDLIGLITFVALYFGFQIVFIIVVRCKRAKEISSIKRVEAQFKRKSLDLVKQ